MAWTRQWQCGFEADSGNYPSIEYRIDSGDDGSTSGTYKYTGSYSYRATNFSTANIGHRFATPRTMIRGSYMLYSASTLTGGSYGAWIWKWTNSAGWSNGIIAYGHTGNIELVVNGATQDTISVSSIGFNDLATWRQCALVIKANASSGYVSFYYNADDTPVLTWTGNTSTDISGVWLAGSPSTSYSTWQNHYFDDVYVDYSSGTDLDNRPPIKRFWPIWPNAAGADSDFAVNGAATHLDAIDTRTSIDHEEDYIWSMLSDDRDTFNMDACPAIPEGESIRAVIPVAIARGQDIGGNISVHTYDGSIYDDGTAQDVTIEWDYFWSRMPTTPSGTLWNSTAVDAIQVGVKSGGL